MTTIGPTLVITGELTSQEDITVHGTLKGQLLVEAGTLRIAQPGRVDAQVRAAEVTVEGTVEGSIAAQSRIELSPTARVTGTLTAPTLVLQDGAQFNGSINADNQAKNRNPAGLKLADPKTVAKAV